MPEQGAYAHADRVFLVRMSLLGRFHEVDEPLFLARRHASQSMALPATAPTCARACARTRRRARCRRRSGGTPSLAGRITFSRTGTCSARTIVRCDCSISAAEDERVRCRAVVGAVAAEVLAEACARRGLRRRAAARVPDDRADRSDVLPGAMKTSAASERHGSKRV